MSHLKLHFALHTSHCTFHTPHSTLHTPHSTLHTALFPLHTSHFTLHTSHFPLHIPHFTLHSPHFTLLTSHCFLHTPNFTLHTPRFSLHFSHSTLHTPHFTLHTPHFALHSSRPTLHNWEKLLHTEKLLHFSLLSSRPHTSHFSLLASHRDKLHHIGASGCTSAKLWDLDPQSKPKNVVYCWFLFSTPHILWLFWTIQHPMITWIGWVVTLQNPQIWYDWFRSFQPSIFQSRYSTSPSFPLRSIKPSYRSTWGAIKGSWFPVPRSFLGVGPSATFLRLIVQHAHNHMKTVRISIGLLCVATAGSFPN